MPTLVAAVCPASHGVEHHIALASAPLENMGMGEYNGVFH